jgi:hypothetical protein
MISNLLNTPFVNDIKDGGFWGIFNATMKGIERERLRSEVSILNNKYKRYGGILEILNEYNTFAKSFKYTELVNIFRRKLLRNVNYTTIVQQLSEKINNTLYVLKLNNDKYYVGFDGLKYVSKIEINDFIEQNGPIINILEYKNKSKNDEYIEFLSCIQKYGIKNVRGCNYKKTKLNESEIIELQKLLLYLSNKKIIFNEDFMLDYTNIITFVMHDFGNYTVEEIAEIRSLKPATIINHLDKCKKFDVNIT